MMFRSFYRQHCSIASLFRSPCSLMNYFSCDLLFVKDVLPAMLLPVVMCFVHLVVLDGSCLSLPKLLVCLFLPSPEFSCPFLPKMETSWWGSQSLVIKASVFQHFLHLVCHFCHFCRMCLTLFSISPTIYIGIAPISFARCRSVVYLFRPTGRSYRLTPTSFAHCLPLVASTCHLRLSHTFLTQHTPRHPSAHLILHHCLSYLIVSATLHGCSWYSPYHVLYLNLSYFNTSSCFILPHHPSSIFTIPNHPPSRLVETCNLSSSFICSFMSIQCMPVDVWWCLIMSQQVFFIFF